MYVVLQQVDYKSRSIHQMGGGGGVPQGEGVFNIPS